jgi:peptidoglycan/xylan/chitin deacetylase (PgdA/CDA1 family)
MKRKFLNTTRKLKKSVQSLVVLAIFIAPMYTTAKWVAKAYSSGQDLRKVVSITPSNVRSVDTYTGTIRPFQEPIISITFDDGWESVYTNAVPIMQKYGITSTQYIISGSLDNQSYMSKEQILSLKTAGTEIAAHTVSHKDLTTLTDQELDAELKGSKTTLEAYFGPMKEFTSPLGAYNARTLAAIHNYYRSHKNAEGDPAADELEAINIADDFNPYSIKSYSIRATTTDNDIKKLIQSAIAHNGWLVLTYHQVDSSSSVYSVTPETFSRQIGIVADSTLRSATIGTVLDVLGAK